MYHFEESAARPLSNSMQTFYRVGLLDRIVFLKEINAGRSQYKVLIQEAQILARMNHTNIIAIHDAIYEEPYFYIVTELMDDDLANLLKTERKIPVFRAVEIIRQLLSGLIYAHDKNVVYKDIKPKNILIKIF